MSLIEILEFHLFTIGEFTLTIHNLAQVLFIIVVNWALLMVVNKLFKRHWKRDNWETGRSHSLFKIVQYVSWILATIACFDSLGRPYGCQNCRVARAGGVGGGGWGAKKRVGARQP